VGARASIDLADIDGDGKYEFAVGNLRGGIGIYDASVSTGVEEIAIANSPYDFVVNQVGEELEIGFLGKPFRQAEVKVMDMTGRILESERVELYQPKIKLEMPGVSGIYFVKIEFDGQFGRIEKVICQRS
jgi:hypothetical protein